MPSPDKYRIFPLGDSALTVEFGNDVMPELNRRALDLVHYFQHNPFEGLIEAVPAYASTTVFYDPVIVKRLSGGFESAFDAVCHLAERGVPDVGKTTERNTHVIQIPITIDDESALDIDFLSRFSGLTNEEVVSIFLGRIYRVYMLGFLPGFAYMGEVDERIAAPRKKTPRLKVPKGSVGVAGKQTGIYPLESPGGWQIIGRTEMQMFDAFGEIPCPLKPGNKVKFVRA